MPLCSYILGFKFVLNFKHQWKVIVSLKTWLNCVSQFEIDNFYLK